MKTIKNQSESSKKSVRNHKQIIFANRSTSNGKSKTVMPVSRDKSGRFQKQISPAEISNSIQQRELIKVFNPGLHLKTISLIQYNNLPKSFENLKEIRLKFKDESGKEFISDFLTPSKNAINALIRVMPINKSYSSNIARFLSIPRKPIGTLIIQNNTNLSEALNCSGTESKRFSDNSVLFMESVYYAGEPKLSFEWVASNNPSEPILTLSEIHFWTEDNNDSCWEFKLIPMIDNSLQIRETEQTEAETKTLSDQPLLNVKLSNSRKMWIKILSIIPTSILKIGNLNSQRECKIYKPSSIGE